MNRVSVLKVGRGRAGGVCLFISLLGVEEGVASAVLQRLQAGGSGVDAVGEGGEFVLFVYLQRVESLREESGCSGREQEVHKGAGGA